MSKVSYGRWGFYRAGFGRAEEKDIGSGIRKVGPQVPVGPLKQLCDLEQMAYLPSLSLFPGL